eukprot:1332191-Amorphochlora_amoeboformis.AAC.2
MNSGGRLVSEKYDLKSPSPLEDGVVYSEVGTNGVLDINPPIVHFQSSGSTKPCRCVVKIRNTSHDSQRFHILQIPPSSDFCVQYSKKGTMLAPGLIQELTVLYKPKSWEYKHGEIRIHSAGGNLRIPIHAYPVVSRVKLPKTLDLGCCLSGESVQTSFTLKCRVPVIFEFKITELDINPYFDVNPKAGTFTSGSPSRITINFTPSRQTTTRMRLKLEVSQFNFEPIVCTVVGSCVDMESHATQKLRLENIKGHAALQEGRGGEREGGKVRGGIGGLSDSNDHWQLGTP